LYQGQTVEIDLNVELTISFSWQSKEAAFLQARHLQAGEIKGFLLTHDFRVFPLIQQRGLINC
jgi:hypothetical protein